MRSTSAEPQAFAALGLPDGVRACLFDLDGVLTQTAKIHAAAWKEMFDGFLGGRATEHRQPFRPFDPVPDYDEYVDGKPRYDVNAAEPVTRAIPLARVRDLPTQPAEPGAGATESGGMTASLLRVRPPLRGAQATRTVQTCGVAMSTRQQSLVGPRKKEEAG